jgi:hypothetical protein
LLPLVSAETPVRFYTSTGVATRQLCREELSAYYWLGRLLDKRAGTEKDRVGFRRGEIAECPVHRVIEPGPGFL